MAKPSRTYKAKPKSKPNKRRTRSKLSTPPATKQYPSLRALLFLYALCFVFFAIHPYAPIWLILAYKGTLIMDILSGARYVSGSKQALSMSNRMWLDTCAAWFVAYTLYPNSFLAIPTILISGLTMIIVKQKPQWIRRLA